MTEIQILWTEIHRTERRMHITDITDTNIADTNITDTYQHNRYLHMYNSLVINAQIFVHFFIINAQINPQSLQQRAQSFSLTCQCIFWTSEQLFHTLTFLGPYLETNIPKPRWTQIINSCALWHSPCTREDSGLIPGAVVVTLNLSLW